MLKLLSTRIKSDIDNSCKQIFTEGHRKHLGASQIGNECNRFLWYQFRWCFLPNFDGRLLRLFNRGHLEEARFKSWLDNAGFKVASHDENNKQYRIFDLMGHFGGSIDGKGYFPDYYGIQDEVLFEYKTTGTGKGFSDLDKSGVQLSKPQYYDQACVYGYKLNIEHSVFLSINKNDDDIYAEVIKLDFRRGENLIKKAEKIIFSSAPPQKLSENPTFFKCKACSAYEICHERKQTEKNCRSCDKAIPSENGTWICSFFGNQMIPDEFIATGCNVEGGYSPIAGIGK